MRFIFILLFPLVLFSQNNWQPLFNGKNLDGWKKLNGEAEYSAENGEIIGISKINTPNTFLTTEKNYGDFILELEVKIDSGLNSGIQFRSHSLPEYLDGLVHGYQAEIDPSPRAYSGGIYDEARRGWIYPLTQNEPGRKAFRLNDWNQYRIEAIGPEIRIWVNGVNTANIVDDASLSGFIALQVHSISEEKQAGKRVRWRNIRILTENMEAERWPIQPNAVEENFIPNFLTENEKQNGWRLLWDGATFDQWTLPDSAAGHWEISGNSLVGKDAPGMDADLVSEDTFRFFELKWEFKFDRGAAGGVAYFFDPEHWACRGFEYQILDNKGHPDGRALAPKGGRNLASLYDLIPPENLSELNRPPENCLRWGEGWQSARIVVDGSRIEHWLNQYKMVEFDRGSQVFRALLGRVFPLSDECPDFWSGHIVLQNHGGGVAYRSIKVREKK